MDSALAAPAFAATSRRIAIRSVPFGLLLCLFAAVVYAIASMGILSATVLVNRTSSATAAPPPAGVTDAAGLAGRVRGYVLIEEPVGGIAAIEFPKGRRFHVRAPSNAGGTGPLPVYGLSNPDSSGRVAFVETDILTKRHRLNVINLDGSGSRTLFTRSGDAIWDHVVGGSLALSEGGMVALVSNLAGRQMPGALLYEGTIEVVDLDRGKARKLQAPALDDHLAWLPDGRHLLHTKLVPRSALPQLPLAPDGFGSRYAKWPKIPAVYVLDVDSGEDRLLHVGEWPVPSPDGSFVIVGGSTGRGATAYRSVRTDTGASTPIKSAGGAPLAVVANDLFLCRGAPAAGVPARFTSNNSPLVGPKPMEALNGVVPDTDQFETVVTDVDPRHHVTFGTGPAAADAPTTRQE